MLFRRIQSWQQYEPLQYASREEFSKDVKNLKENNIGTRLVYPAIHTQEVYKEYNNLSYPNAEKYSKAGLWLPSSVTLTDKNIKDICEYINKYKINI